MATSDPIYWETTTPQMRDLLRFIGQQPFIIRFYLAGNQSDHPRNPRCRLR